MPGLSLPKILTSSVGASAGGTAAATVGVGLWEASFMVCPTVSGRPPRVTPCPGWRTPVPAGLAGMAPDLGRCLQATTWIRRLAPGPGAGPSCRVRWVRHGRVAVFPLPAVAAVSGNPVVSPGGAWVVRVALFRFSRLRRSEGTGWFPRTAATAIGWGVRTVAAGRAVSAAGGAAAGWATWRRGRRGGGAGGAVAGRGWWGRRAGRRAAAQAYQVRGGY